MNKKGMDISINFIIVAALALIALIVIALVFTGGIKEIFGQTSDIQDIGTQELSLAEESCKWACTTNSMNSWFEQLPENFQEKQLYDCDDLLDARWEDGKCELI